jgi:chorismate mutase
MQAGNVKFPYGISNFEKLAEQNFVFVDKTKYIELLENEENYSVFLRPRRMGKSLFVSVLEYYYDMLEKDKFEKLFSKYYIGKNPTSGANSFRVLKFDFSGIDTQTKEDTYRFFLDKIRMALHSFMERYNLPDSEERISVLEGDSPGSVLNRFFSSLKIWKEKNSDKIPTYLLIDEYDHFTNEILIRDLGEFKTSVSQNGYIRKFYETIKIATQQGLVDRFFITGVSPVTMDGLTSGFNIVKHLSDKAKFHDMMGFTEMEVRDMLNKVLLDKSRENQIMEDLKNWYNGYSFNTDLNHRVYNSDMVLYFLDNFKQEQKYPKKMLDPNIMPDYGKLKQLFELANYRDNINVLEEILQKGFVNAEQIFQFSFEQPFDRTAFVNLLYYLGNLTLKGSDEFDMPIFVIPNYVIKELYWKYFAFVLQQEAALETDESNKVITALRETAGGNLGALLGVVEKLLQNLSNRDFRQFDEKYIKSIILAYVHQVGFYYTRTEREITNDGYLDIELLQHPSNRGKIQQYVIELKYLKKSEENQLQSTMQAAKEQLTAYLEKDELLKSMNNLKAVAVVAVKDKIYWEEL